MHRLACLELPAFPLQIALREHPDWRGEPAAIVERDAPHGLVLWANEKARASGVLPGQRYAAALGICAELRATEISESVVASACTAVLHELHSLSPDVEPHPEEAGVYWISGLGMERLFGAPREWAEQILERVSALGFDARLAVGFRRFAVYACVKGQVGETLVVLDDPIHEARTAANVPLARVALEPKARDALEKLAVTTLGAFARLPSGGILQRFGASVHRLHRTASGALEEALAPAPEAIPLAAHVDLDFPLAALDDVLAHTEELLRPMCALLEKHGEATSALTLRIDLDDGTSEEQSIRPAWASCDIAWLMRLVRMRLESWVLRCGVVRIELTLGRMPRGAEQATLFLTAKRRSAQAASRAFSALRALYGEHAVVRARLASAHLPEHSFTWERCDELPLASPRRVLQPPWIRGIFEKPIGLPPRGRREPDGWHVLGTARGPVVKLWGPYRLSGGWWRATVVRDGYFAELAGGQIAWLFHDLTRRRWFLQGTVS